MNLPITTRVAKARGGACSPAKQMDNKRSTKRFARAEKVAAKGKKRLTKEEIEKLIDY